MTTGTDTDTWVDKYGDYLFRYACVRVNDKSTVEDLIQDTFVSALKSRSSFKGKSSEKTWLVSILKHKIFDYYRHKKITTEKELTISSDIEEFFDKKGRWQKPLMNWGKNPEKHLEDKRFKEVLQQCIGKLKEIQRQVFTFREIDGLSTVEICKIFKITQTNLSVMLYRARHSLRRCLTLNWFKKE
ncbi:sigma-70 family RNA polymerase sigma factor [Fibrobacterota bacterium]